VRNLLSWLDPKRICFGWCQRGFGAVLSAWIPSTAPAGLPSLSAS
jgi:hypothetical protein